LKFKTTLLKGFFDKFKFNFFKIMEEIPEKVRTQKHHKSTYPVENITEDGLVTK